MTENVPHSTFLEGTNPLQKGNKRCSAESPSECAHAHKLLELTLEKIVEPVLILDKIGTISFCNGGAQKLFQHNDGPLTGKYLINAAQFLEEKTRIPFTFNFDAIFAGDFPNHSLQLVLIDSKQREHLIKLSVAPLLTSDGRLSGAILIMHDITYIHKMETELFKTRKIESVGILASGIAHDFNNILTGIVTNLFMARTLSPTNSESNQLILEAEKEAFRASTLTKQLLSFAQGETPVKETMSVCTILEDSIGYCLSGTNVESNLSIAADIWNFSVDRGQMGQVIQNLIRNGKESMPDGGTLFINATNISINDSVSPSDTAYFLPIPWGLYIKLTVNDTGKGIDPCDLDKIFDPYFTTKPDHSGLGLTTVFAIVKKHDGYITARSTPGVGTTITVYLPAISNKHETPKLSSAKLTKGNNRRILIMDDNDIIRMVVTRLLTKHGYRVTSTTHGAAAVEAYEAALQENDVYQACIMDLTVPGGMGALEATQQIQAIDESAKVIVFSGYSNDPILIDYAQHGFAGVLVKPFSIEDFSAILSSVLE